MFPLDEFLRFFVDFGAAGSGESGQTRIAFKLTEAWNPVNFEAFLTTDAISPHRCLRRLSPSL
jgi:hypothetical protein